ncbi:MAG: sterol desaturase family protein [Bacteroidota bacterium]
MMDFLNNPNTGKYAVIFSIIFFLALETFAGHLKNSNRTKHDWLSEFGGFFLISISSVIGLMGINYLGELFFPNAHFALADLSLWIAVPLYMFTDDIAQYWYHRSAHEHDFLWKHHRVHHAAEQMGIMVSYRNSAMYFLFLPNVWIAAIFTFLGMIPATVIGLIIKQTIVASSHSTVRWDEKLYKIKALSPLMWVIEHIFVTPSFHYAHHGKSKADNISDPNGNFGNAFTLWDQLFGTATFTRKFPVEFGLQTDLKDSWSTQLFYPFITSDKEGSELARGYKKVSSKTNDAIMVELEAGTHLWCQCGFSKNAPFCDGAHHGTKIKPIAFEVKKKRTFKLCNCKLTKTGPFCDNTHLELQPMPSISDVKGAVQKV